MRRRFSDKMGCQHSAHTFRSVKHVKLSVIFIKFLLFSGRGGATRRPPPPSCTLHDDLIHSGEARWSGMYYFTEPINHLTEENTYERTDPDVSFATGLASMWVSVNYQFKLWHCEWFEECEKKLCHYLRVNLFIKRSGSVQSVVLHG